MHRVLIRLGVFFAGLFTLLIIAMPLSCSRSPIEAAVEGYTINDLLEGSVDMSAPANPRARSCVECHAEIVEKWSGSQHAHAMRQLNSALDASAFEPAQVTEHGSFSTHTRMENGKMILATKHSDGTEEVHEAKAVLAIEPLRQYLVPFPGGRLQAHELAFDPRSNDWFNVFGEQDRRSSEWGHWSNRGMNWNVQCAYCHTTGLEKKYDIPSDTYNTRWQALGITCAQCHGDMDGHAEAYRTEPHPVTAKRDPALSMQQCASCHARREELTGRMPPGELFLDHYRPALLNTPGIYYADGQVRDEDFEYGSFLMSRKHHKGITCLNCHDPHSGGLVLPAANDTLCLSCHTPPGQHGAVPINPSEHTFHKRSSAGSRCIECHMPVTHYMERDPRRDHGFTVPDPRLTKEHGIPNACNSCHTDQSVDWSIEWAEKWYGEKLTQRRSRDRARVIARAHEADPGVLEDLIAFAKDEEIPAWRYSLLMLLAPWSGHASVAALARDAASDPSPLIRSAGVQLHSSTPGDESLYWQKLKDPVRLVRLDAAWALRGRIESNTPAYVELRAQIDFISDQPAGALRQAELAITEGRIDDAVNWAKKAAAWEPTSAYLHHMLGRISNLSGDQDSAVASLMQAAELEPENTEHSYALALLFSEIGNTEKSRDWLMKTVQTDPSFSRAWYNLGLAHAGLEKLDEAVTALRRAEELEPDNPDYLYARATIHLRQGDHQAAVSAAQKALAVRPGHGPSRALIQSMGN